jgi:hypothetical protein
VPNRITDDEPSPLNQETHELMNQSLGRVAALLVRQGTDPCPAVSLAQDLMEPAFRAWNRLIEQVESSKLGGRAAESCGNCGSDQNDFDGGGSEGCFHCLRCGWLQCADFYAQLTGPEGDRSS